MQRRMYSEFFIGEKQGQSGCEEGHCSHCGMSHRYLRNFKGFASEVCETCEDFKQPVFKGLKALQQDVDLQPGERIGVTTSGGKDSIHALATMVDMFGKDRVVALTHRKQGLTHPLAEADLDRAVELLGVKLIKVEETGMLGRFRQNLSLLLKNPDPALVRVVLCAGCRYGITRELYAAGVRAGIRKYVSAASYLELAPFKEELLERRGGGDLDAGFRQLMSEHPEYDYGDNMKYIIRDNGLKYKSNRQDDCGGLKERIKEYQLFDLDNYLPNDPEKVEAEVVRRFGWQRPERSWHFDCEIEAVKDVFYYGLLGFTETDFKLSAMVRHGLMDLEEARRQLSVVRYDLEHSYSRMSKFLCRYGLEESLPDLRSFYRSSPYLQLDMAEASGADSDAAEEMFEWGMA